MMRSAMVAALALSPLMVHAQAVAPAQPQAASAPVLDASLNGSKGMKLAAVAAEDRAAANEAAVRVSTGVVAPRLIYTVHISARSSFMGSQIGPRAAVVLMTVDSEGRPSDVKIVQSADPSMDGDVLAAVRQFRFAPGTLDGQKTSVPVRLELTIQPGE